MVSSPEYCWLGGDAEGRAALGALVLAFGKADHRQVRAGV